MTQKEFQEKLEDLYKKYTEAHAVDLEKIPVEMMLDKNYLRNYTIFSYAKIGEEIEKIIDRELPVTAYKRTQWWGNNKNGHSQAAAWLDVGYKTCNIILGQSVTFEKVH